MSPPLPPASIRQCPAQSRSFLLGPDGPAGLHLDSACAPALLWDYGRTGTRNKIRITKSPRFEGNPAPRPTLPGIRPYAQ
jgi:hypothetical protein